MLRIQVIPRQGHDAYRLLRAQVIHGAQTWYWANRGKTRLRHKGSKRGYIEVGSADGILVAEVHPHEDRDLYLLTEKFIGRLTAWFSQEIAAVNMQFIEEPPPPRGRRKR